MLVDLKDSKYIDIYNLLRQKHFEFIGYRNLILYMIQTKMDKFKEFDQYFLEYLSSLENYEIVKEKFSNLLKENYTFDNWEIIFEKDMVQLD